MKKHVGLACAAAIISANLAFSADIYWDFGGTPTTLWTTLANWNTAANGSGGDPAAAPGASDTAFFNITSLNSPQIVTLGAPLSIRGLVFNNTGTTAINTDGVANRAITLGLGGITINAGAGTVTFGTTTANQRITFTLGASQMWKNDSANALALNANNTVNTASFILTIDGTGDISAAGIVSGTGGIVKNGSGALTLTAVNTFSTGGFTLNVGRVRVGNNAALGAGTVILNGGVLSANSATARTLANAYTLGGNVTLGHAVDTGVLTFSGPGTLTGNRTLTIDSEVILSGAIGDGGGGFGLTKSGEAMLTLAAANTYGGNTLINAGILNMASTGALPGWGNFGRYTVASGATLAVGNSVTDGNISTMLGTGNFNAGSRIGFDTAAGDRIYGSNISDTGAGELGLTKIGANILALTGNNTFSGDVDVRQGVLLAGSNTALGSGAVTFRAGTTLTNAASVALGNAVTLAPGIVTNGVMQGTTVTLSGGISGPGRLDKLGAGVLTLSGSVNMSSNLVVYGGTVNLNGPSSFGTAGSGIDLVQVRNNGVLNIANDAVFGARLRVGYEAGTTAVVNQTSGTVVYQGDYGMLIGNTADGGAGIYNLIGGVLSNAPGSEITLGTASRSTAIFNMSGGTLFTPTLEVGRNSGASAGSTNTFAQTGGNATVTTLVMGRANADSPDMVMHLLVTNGTFTVTTGFTTLAPQAGQKATIYFGPGADITLPAMPVARGVGAVVNLTFDGNWLTPAAASATFITNLTSAVITDNDVVLNVLENRNITIGQGLADASGHSGALLKTGSGVLTLTGHNTYSGGTIVSNGVLSVASVDGVVSLPGWNTPGSVEVRSGAALAVGNDVTVGQIGTILSTGNLAAGASIGFDTTRGDRSYGTVIEDTLAGALGVVKVGANTLTLSVGNSFTGGTAIREGALRATHAGALGTTDAGTTVFSGAALELDGGITVGAEALSLAGTGISTGGALRNVSGDNTYGGVITLAAAARINSVADILTLSSGSAVTGDFGLTFGGAGSIVLDDSFQGLSLTKADAGTLTLNAANTHTGGTTLSAGTLNLGDAGALGSGTFTISGGFLDNTSGSAMTLANTIAITVGGTITFAGTDDLNLGTGTVTLTGNRTVIVNGSTLTIGGAIVDDGATGRQLIKEGSGTLLLSGANAYKNTTYIRAGTLKFGANDTLPTDRTIIFQNRTGADIATLDLAGWSQTLTGTLTLSEDATAANQQQAGAQTRIIDSVGGGVLKLGGAVTYNAGPAGEQHGQTLISANLDLNGTTRTFTINDSDQTTEEVLISGAIGNTGAAGAGLTKAGVGTMILSGANTYDGLTTVSAGTLVLNRTGGGTLSETAAVTVGGGVLQLNVAQTVAGLTLSSGSIAGPATLTSSSFALTGSGAVGASLAGTGGLTKSGAGVASLSANNSLTGTLTVQGGLLSLSTNGQLGSISSILVTNAATFAIDNHGANLGDRVANSAAIRLAGGVLSWTNNAAAATAYSETLGALTVQSTNNRILAAQAAADGSATLTFASLAREGRATLLVDAAGIGADNRNRIFFTAAPTTIGGILPTWVLLTNAVAGRLDLAEYNVSAGLRAPTYAAAETGWTGGTINARPTTSQTLSATRTVNTLVLDNGIGFSGQTADRMLRFDTADSAAIVLQTGGASTNLNNGNSGVEFHFGNNPAVFHTLGNLILNRGDNDNRAIRGTAGFTKLGAGTLVLNTAGQAIQATAVSNMLGRFSIQEGTVELRHANAAGGTVLDLDGGSLTLRNDASTTFKAQDVTVTNTPLVVSQSGTLIIGRITAGGTVTHTLGNLTLRPGVQFTLNHAGESSFNNNTGYGLTVANITLEGDATLDIRTGRGNGNGALTATNLTGPGDLVVRGNEIIRSDLRVTGALTLAGDLFVGQAGAAAVMRAVNGYGGVAGNITVNSGILASGVNFTRELGTGAGQVQFIGGVNGGVSAGGAAAQTAVFTLLQGGEALPLVWGSQFFNVGNLRLNEDNAAAMVTLVNSLDFNSVVGPSIERQIVVDSNVAKIEGNLFDSGTGTAGLLKAGGSTLWLTGNLTYEGATRVTTGYLRVGENALPAGNLNLNAGNAYGVLETHGTFTRGLGSGNNQVQIVGTAAADLNSRPGFSAVGGDLIVDIGGDGTGIGSPTLEWNTTFFRPHGTSVTNGALMLASTAATGVLYFKNSIDLNGTDTAVVDRRFQVEGATSVAVLEGAIVNNGGTAIGLQKKAVGTLVLAANNTYDGNTWIQAGTLVVGAGGTTGTLGLGGSVTNSGALAFNRSNNYIVDQLIVGNGSVAQIGSGTLTLSGNNTYSGTTTVTNGALRINGTHTGGGLITASVNGRLGGSGSVGDVRIDAGGILSPGNSIGTLTVASLDLREGAKMEWHLDNDSNLSDLVIVTGSLTGSFVYEFDFLGTGFHNGINPTVYTLIRFGSTPDVNANSFAVKPNSLSTGLSSGGFSIVTVGDDQALQLTVIPEPASLGTLGILALAALLRRRLRRWKTIPLDIEEGRGSVPDAAQPQRLKW